MKKSNIVFALVIVAGIISIPLVRGRERISAVKEIDSMIGLYCNTYDDCRNFYLESKSFPYPMVVSLANEGGETLTYTIKSLGDFPKQDVPTRCPKGKQKIKKCWFVKYGHGGSVK